jgi:hypothetical protein
MARPEDALAHLEPALVSARDQGLTYEEALILLLEVEIGIDDGELLEEAHRLFADLGAVQPQLRHRLPSAML